MVGSVFKAFALLKLFSPSDPALSLTEIARQLDSPKSTVHSMLRTLEALGMVEKLDGNLYAMGKGVISLTQSALVNVQIRDRIAPLLRELSDVTEKSVYLTVPDGTMSLYIYAIETRHRLLARSAVGDRVPLHCTAVGKALLAYLPSAEQKRIISQVGLPRFTDTTITDESELLEELQETYQRGYSIDNQEHETGSFCVGAPILDARGSPIASCSVAGDEPSIIQECRDVFSAKIALTAQEASRRMGYVPSRQQMVWSDEGS